MTVIVIWTMATLLYGLFWLWYVGIKPRVTAEEIDATIAVLEDNEDYSAEQIKATRDFLENDNGKDFVMVNLLKIKEPTSENHKKLQQYQKIFLANLLKRAGHPVFIARAASGNFENVNCHEISEWTAAGMVRYRSRRDFMEIIPETIGSEHHDLKLESLEKTFAYPGYPWMIMGGPKLLAPMAIALAATIAQLIFA